MTNKEIELNKFISSSGAIVDKEQWFTLPETNIKVYVLDITTTGIKLVPESPHKIVDFRLEGNGIRLIIK